MDISDLENDPDELLEWVVDNLYLFDVDQLDTLLHETRAQKMVLFQEQLGLNNED